MPRAHPYHPPIVCYNVEALPPIDKDFYSALADGTSRHQLVEEVTVPPRDGRAWKVKAGQVFRIVCIDGPQVADVNFFNLHNAKVG